MFIISPILSFVNINLIILSQMIKLYYKMKKYLKTSRE